MITPMNYGLNTVQTPRPQSFRGDFYEPQQQGYLPQGVTAPQELKSDTVEISSAKNNIETPQKKGMSKGAKVAMGVGATLATLVGVICAFSKHQTNKLSQLYKDKLVSKIFDKELKFTEAKTREEAVKYATDLGVKEIDKDVTLEVLNHMNCGITDVINKNIGQEVFIPRKYLYMDFEDTYVAGVVKDIKSEHFGTMAVNKKYFNDKFLTEELDKILKPAKSTNKPVEKVKQEESKGLIVNIRGNDKYKELVDRYRKDSTSLSLVEKQSLYNTHYRDYSNELDFIDFVEKNKDKIKLNIEELKKLTRFEQRAAIDKYLKENNITLTLSSDVAASLENGFETIYHEMGHLQDCAKNLKELDLKKWKWELPSWKEAASKKEDRSLVDEVNNRWGGLTYDGYKDLLEKNPEKFKKLYPDLYKHVTDKDIKDTTSKVSNYATTSIGEFVAETYAKMISGKKIPDDVMTLYKKYNGPLPKGFK